MKAFNPEEAPLRRQRPDAHYTEVQLAQWPRRALEGHAIRLTGQLNLMLAPKARLIFVILAHQAQKGI